MISALLRSSTRQTRRAATRRIACVGALAACTWSLGGCSRDKRPAPGPGASASAALAPPSASTPALPAPVASGLPDAALVSSIVNPNADAAYAGPAGTVRGRVVSVGDPAPEQPEVLRTIPDKCAAGKAAYGRLFREGPGHGLADVLVAVTGYRGYVPAAASAQRLTAKGCFFGTRTLALTYGQRIEVVSGDMEPYVPELLGEHGQPQLVATPGGTAVSALYPTRVGRYQLVDNLKLFMTAEVLVLKYATHAVTDAEGRFAIPNVPAGAVIVSALLPATGATATQSVTVEGGKPTEEIAFELRFDAADYARRGTAQNAGAPASSTSAAGKHPAASGRTAPTPAPSR